MKINRAIVSTNNNPDYYQCWPLVAKAWRNIGIEPTIAVIGDINIDHSLGTVIKFPEIDGIESSFISQVTRFLVPILFPNDVCIIGDIDMIPLSREYFNKTIESISNEDFVVYSSDAYQDCVRYPMCYLAGKGFNFSAIVNINKLDLTTYINEIKHLHSLGLGWDTDELYFTNKLINWKNTTTKKLHLLNRGWPNSIAEHRIDRIAWKININSLKSDTYIDAHLPRPLGDHTKSIKQIIIYVDSGNDGYKYKEFRKAILWDKVKSFLKKLFPTNFKIVKTINIKIINKKVIAFSLFGKDERYLKSLLTVINLYKDSLPEWVIRIYISEDCYAKNEYLNHLDIELVVMKGKNINQIYTTWRFLAYDDPNVSVVLFRDIDSVPTEREVLMIRKWEKSNKDFLIIRDHPYHNIKILAGMWGAKRSGKIKSIKKILTRERLSNYFGVDQIFLRDHIYPIIKNDSLIFDSYPRYPEESPIVMPFNNETYIGEIMTNPAFKERDRESLRAYNKQRLSLTNNTLNISGD